MTTTEFKTSEFDVHTVCDYVLLCLKEAGESSNVLKLQKLMYYVQSWNLAFDDQTAFDGEFEAWVHGPVNRDLYSRFVSSKTMYSAISGDDVVNQDAITNIEASDMQLAFNIKSVLESYGAYTGTQLEELTHREKPWIEARQGFRAHERCEVQISKITMKEYYSARLS